jgi:hypothetical protein
MIKGLVAALPAVVISALLMRSTYAQPVDFFRGPCDASAAVALGPDGFVVANDEDNTLRIHRYGQPAPVASVPLAGFLDTGKREADIEGAAAIGSRIWWTASHSRNSKGREQPSRHRIFATDIREGSPPTLTPVGKPYVDLLRDLAEAPALAPYRLEAASRLATEADGGLNIEGLAATPDGGLLIGFRSPLRDARALIVPLTNPAEIIDGKRARLGAPIELDLGGRGIRSMELIDGAYWIVAGPVADRGTFAVYRWSGRAAEAPVLMPKVSIGDLRPEALFAIPASTRVRLLSDDGGVPVQGVECKDLPMSKQGFRSVAFER